MNLKSVVLPPTLFNFTITAATLWSRVIVVVAKNYHFNAEISNIVLKIINLELSN